MKLRRPPWTSRSLRTSSVRGLLPDGHLSHRLAVHRARSAIRSKSSLRVVRGSRKARRKACGDGGRKRHRLGVTPFHPSPPQRVRLWRRGFVIPGRRFDPGTCQEVDPGVSRRARLVSGQIRAAGAPSHRPDTPACCSRRSVSRSSRRAGRTSRRESAVQSSRPALSAASAPIRSMIGVSFSLMNLSPCSRVSQTSKMRKTPASWSKPAVWMSRPSGASWRSSAAGVRRRSWWCSCRRPGSRIPGDMQLPLSAPFVGCTAS